MRRRGGGARTGGREPDATTTLVSTTMPRSGGEHGEGHPGEHRPDEQVRVGAPGAWAERHVEDGAPEWREGGRGEGRRRGRRRPGEEARGKHHAPIVGARVDRADGAAHRPGVRPAPPSRSDTRVRPPVRITPWRRRLELERAVVLDRQHREPGRRLDAEVGQLDRGRRPPRPCAVSLASTVDRDRLVTPWMVSSPVAWAETCSPSTTPSGTASGWSSVNVAVGNSSDSRPRTAGRRRGCRCRSAAWSCRPRRRPR